MITTNVWNYREVAGCRIRVTHARPRTRGSGRRFFNSNMRCYQCGYSGHFYRDCPELNGGGGGGGGADKRDRESRYGLFWLLRDKAIFETELGFRAWLCFVSWWNFCFLSKCTKSLYLIVVLWFVRHMVLIYMVWLSILYGFVWWVSIYASWWLGVELR